MFTRLDSERGSMLVFMTFMIMVFIMLFALVIDMGFRYAERQNLINICDAVAMAGAVDLPDSKPYSIADAIRYAKYNSYDGVINIGAFLDTSIALPLAQYSGVQLRGFLIDALAATNSYELDYDYFISIPVASFAQSEWNASLVGDLTGSYPTPSSLAQTYNPNKHFEMTVVAGCPAPEIVEKGLNVRKAFFCGITEKTTAMFAGSFYDYYTALGARAVSFNGRASDDDMGDYDASRYFGGSHLHPSSLVINDRLYQGTATTGSWGGEMWCLYPDSLLPIWSFDSVDGNLKTYNADGSVATTTNYAAYANGTGSHGIQTNPAYSDGKLYFQSTNGNIYCIDAATGMPQWKSYDSDWEGQEANVWRNSSPVVYDDYLVIGEVDGTVVSLNKNTGAVVSTFTTTAGYAVVSDPIIVGNDIVIGSNNGKVYSLDLNTDNGALTQNWSYTTGGSVRGRPTYYENYVYIGSDDDKLHKLNASTGASTWQYSTGVNPSYPNFRNGAAIEERSNGSGYDKYVHIGDSSGKIYCLKDNGGSATLQWSTTPSGYDVVPTASRVESVPIIIDGTIYYVTRNELGGTKKGMVYAIDAATGAILDYFALGNDSHASVIQKEGFIYFGGCDSYLYKVGSLERLTYLADIFLVQ